MIFFSSSVPLKGEQTSDSDVKKSMAFQPLTTPNCDSHVTNDIEIYYMKFVPFGYSCLGARDT